VRQDNKAGGHKENILHGALSEDRQWVEIPKIKLQARRRGASKGKQHILLIRPRR